MWFLKSLILVPGTCQNVFGESCDKIGSLQNVPSRSAFYGSNKLPSSHDRHVDIRENEVRENVVFMFLIPRYSSASMPDLIEISVLTTSLFLITLS
jgi:hypothetical protein